MQMSALLETLTDVRLSYQKCPTVNNIVILTWHDIMSVVNSLIFTPPGFVTIDLKQNNQLAYVAEVQCHTRNFTIVTTLQSTVMDYLVY